MLCPALKELPPPPQGKTGWPWTEESPQLPDVMADGKAWPQISIVTPNYNYGRFIEEAIRSVLLQGYPNFEYIILDNKSTDNSIEIIKKYEKWIAKIIIEPDSGQSNALNKGFSKCNGEIIAWINSDDFYLPNVFSRIATLMWDGEKIVRPVVYGTLNVLSAISKTSEDRHVAKQADFDKLLAVWNGGGLLIPQAGLFMAGYLAKQNPLDEKINYIMDYELWLRLIRHVRFYCIGQEPLGTFRMHKESKTGKKIWWFDFELARICPRYWGKGSLSFWGCLWRFWWGYMFNRFIKRFIAWPTLSFFRTGKNAAVGRIIAGLGLKHYNRIKSRFLKPF